MLKIKNHNKTSVTYIKNGFNTPTYSLDVLKNNVENLYVDYILLEK